VIAPEVRIALAGWPTDVGWYTLPQPLLERVAQKVVGDEVVNYPLLRHLFASYPDARGFLTEHTLRRRLLLAARRWQP